MIRIHAELDGGNAVITVDGHEGHARGGVVCAAVSAIVHTALLGLEAVAAQNPDLVSIHIKENKT